MLQIGMHEAKTRLSELVKLLYQGEQICLTNHGEIVAELTIPHKKRQIKAAAIMRKLHKLVKAHPLGKHDELMAWRREGLK
jgi:antitoxin (DNA-binding transcriptional repressor) of toxin-antitoxin stability system